MRLAKCASALGAEVVGVDLSKGLDRDAAAMMRAAFAQHSVLVFRDQQVNDRNLARFARIFGRLQTFHQPNGQEEVAAEVFTNTNMDANGNLLRPDGPHCKMMKINWLWHIDGCYREIPNRAIVLYASRVTPRGGDTSFVNAAMAYDALSEKTKKWAMSFTARHSFEYLVKTQDLPPIDDAEVGRLPKADHPLVRQHVDGRRSLFLSPPYMERIYGMTQEQSLSLIGELTEWATRERFRYQHQWRPHDVVIWDNSWTMHKVAPFDLTSDERVMRGATVLGTEPVRSVR